MVFWDILKKWSSGSNENQGQDLFRFILEKNITEIQKILNENPDSLRKASPNGEYPIHAAIKANHPQILQLLLESGDEINRKLPRTGETPLHIAIKNKFKTIISLLLKNGADFSASDMRGNIPIVNIYEMKDFEFLKQVVENNTQITEKHLEKILIKACLDGSVEIVEFLLEKKVDPNYPNDKNSTPLMVAIRQSDQSLFDLLSKRGANINFLHSKSGLTPLACAMARGNQVYIDKILSCGGRADIGCDRVSWLYDSAMGIAVRSKDESMIKTLLPHLNSDQVKIYFDFALETGMTEVAHYFWEKGIKPDARTLSILNKYEKLDEWKNRVIANLSSQGRQEWEIVSENLSSLKIFLSRNREQQNLILIEGEPLLIFFTKLAKIPACAYLLDHGWDVNIRDSKGQTPLFYALFMHPQKSELLLTLLEKGADPNATDNNGISDFRKALLETVGEYYARSRKNLDLCKQLLKYGASIEKAEDGEPPILKNAILDDQFEKVKWLLENGANVNIADSEGSNALHWVLESWKKVTLRYKDPVEGTSTSAAFLPASEIVGKIELLLQYCANTSQRNRHGDTPYDLAKKVIERNSLETENWIRERVIGSEKILELLCQK